MGKATLSTMEQLHEDVAQTMLEELRKARASGEPVQASLLAAVTKFLKDNHIEAGVGNADQEGLEKAMADLKNLPYDGEVPSEYKQ